MNKKKQKRVEALINVHHVAGEEYAVEYLRNADKDLVEGLFFQAKMYGRAEFSIDDQQHELVRKRDLTYDVNALEDDDTSDIKHY